MTLLSNGFIGSKETGRFVLFTQRGNVLAKILKRLSSSLPVILRIDLDLHILLGILVHCKVGQVLKSIQRLSLLPIRTPVSSPFKLTFTTLLSSSFSIWIVTVSPIALNTLSRKSRILSFVSFFLRARITASFLDSKETCASLFDYFIFDLVMSCPSLMMLL